jgi:hypothetical protein
MGRRSALVEQRKINPGFGKMHFSQRLLDRHQPLPGPHGDRQCILEIGPMFVQQPFHQHAHLTGSPPFRLMIDRDDATDVQRELVVFAYDFIL